MKVLSKILGITILIGLIMSVSAFFMGLDPINLRAFFTDEDKYGEMLTETTDQNITELIVNLTTRDIVIHYVEQDGISVTYYAHESKDTWTFDDSQEGIYQITHEEKFELSDMINFKFTPKEIMTVNIYIPEAWIINYDLQTHTGLIKLQFEETQEVGNVLLYSNTGSIYVNHIQATTLDLTTNTGSIVISDTTVLSSVSADSDTGSIRMTDVDSVDIALSTDTGALKLENVTGRLLSGDVDTGSIALTNATFSSDIILHSSTGDVILLDVIATSYTIDSSTGDVRITLDDVSMCRYDLKTSTGNIKVSGVDQGKRHVTTTGNILMKIDVGTGNIRINS